MSQETREIVYEQPPDYSVVYADNIILELGDTNCRLVFYQDMIQVNEDGTGVDKSKKYKRWKFEVRIPQEALRKLAENAARLLQLRRQALDMTRGKDDPKITDAWWKYTQQIESTLYDTEHPFVEYKDLQSLQDKYDDLVGRTTQFQKGDKDAFQ